MQVAIADRRRTPRIPCRELVAIQMKSGGVKGHPIFGFAGDISDGGMGLDVNVADFQRGTRMQVELPNGFLIDCWVCHTSVNEHSTHLGLSFDVVEDDV
jgi:hypothetical protein